MLVNLQDAICRIAFGERPWEFETSDFTFRILGPGCSFSPDFLERCKREGRYAQTIGDATSITRQRGITLTGAWFQRNNSNLASPNLSVGSVKQIP